MYLAAASKVETYESVLWSHSIESVGL